MQRSRPNFSLLMTASPDLVLYLDENYPRREEEERRYLNLNQWRVPDLVGEVSDMTIASDV